jgi:hypothetical protein
VPLLALPTPLLPRFITIALPLTQQEIADLGVPRAGTWQPVIINSTCQLLTDAVIQLVVSESGSVVTLSDGSVLNRVASGVYVEDEPNAQLTLEVISPELISVTGLHPEDNCGFEIRATYIAD